MTIGFDSLDFNDGLVLCLEGFEGTGLTIHDISKSRDHGILPAAPATPTWAQLATGLGTLRFDGNDYVNIDVVLASLAATTRGTWMTWIMLDDATPAATSMVISFGDTDAATLVDLLITTAGKFYSELHIVGVNQWSLQTDAVALSDGVYVHIALIQDGVFPVLLVNGVQVAQAFIGTTDTTAWFSALAGLDNGRIGCLNYNSGGNTLFVTNGNLALTKLINTNLTVEQVRAIINREKWWFGYV